MSYLLDVNGFRLVIRRGTSPTHTFTVTDKATGEAKDLTGASELTFAVAANAQATTRDLQLTLGSGTGHNGSGGVASVTITTTQTEALPVGRRWVELWITDSAGRRDVPASGWCDVRDTLISLT